MRYAALLEQLCQGSEKAMQDIYLSCREKCIAYALRYLLLPHESYEDAAEMYQEAVLILFDNAVLGGIKSFSAAPSTYLISIMKNRHRSRLRKTDNWLPLINEPISKEDSISMINRRLTKKTLARLGERCRQMLVLRYTSELDFASIASEMGYKNGDTVRNLIVRCRKDFAQIFLSLNEEE